MRRPLIIFLYSLFFSLLFSLAPVHLTAEESFLITESQLTELENKLENWKKSIKETEKSLKISLEQQANLEKHSHQLEQNLTDKELTINKLNEYLKTLENNISEQNEIYANIQKENYNLKLKLKNRDICIIILAFMFMVSSFFLIRKII